MRSQAAPYINWLGLMLGGDAGTGPCLSSVTAVPGDDTLRAAPPTPPATEAAAAALPVLLPAVDAVGAAAVSGPEARCVDPEATAAAAATAASTCWGVNGALQIVAAWWGGMSG